ncbi:MAG: glycosyltransferase [Proteobacteria bacterium]|nr:glycosyltransferase [Pseudomonadota bacterium]
MTSINLVAFENAVGNSRDIALLSAALRALGCEVTVTVPSKYARRRRRHRLVRAFAAARRWYGRRRAAQGRASEFDLTVMLEHVWPEELHRGRRNVIVPNPEFFDRHDRALLGAFDRVWAKTDATRAIFARLGCACSATGFDSADRHLAEVAREPTFLHLAGKSRMKGTAELVALWSRHPGWPTLTVVHSLPRVGELPRAANIVYHTQFLADDELRALQNRSQFHVCTSETEGWGHYIGEALGVGAVVLATDAAPMNELVTPERGILLPARASGQQHLATTYRLEPGALERGVEAALALDGAARARLGAAARAWFLANKQGFAARLAAALADLGDAPP